MSADRGPAGRQRCERALHPGADMPAKGGNLRTAARAIVSAGAGIARGAPASPRERFDAPEQEGDEIVCLGMPSRLTAVDVRHRETAPVADEDGVPLPESRCRTKARSRAGPTE